MSEIPGFTTIPYMTIHYPKRSRDHRVLNPRLGLVSCLIGYILTGNDHTLSKKISYFIDTAIKTV